MVGVIFSAMERGLGIKKDHSRRPSLSHIYLHCCALVGFIVFTACGGGGALSDEVKSDVTMDRADLDSDLLSQGAQGIESPCDDIRRGVGSEGDWLIPEARMTPLIQDIPPQLTDEKIVLHSSDKSGAPTAHRVYLPDNPIERLFVFFPGTGATPQKYEQILSLAGSVGYHVIGLVYANQLSVAGTCQDSEDECLCFGNIRMEILTGSNTSEKLQVGLADSVDNRLKKLLSHLHENAPDQGWGSFLDESGEPIWGKVALGGHSQGGGHVALMAQRYNLERALFFSSPSDTCLSGGQKKVADWVGWPLNTPVERLFGLSHLRDGEWGNHRLVWQGLGMGGGHCTVDVDDSYAPYGGATMLVTSSAPGSGACPDSGVCEAAHEATVADVSMDSEKGPLLVPVWHYMLMYEP